MANNKFNLNNFRVFDPKGAEFVIAPITVLTGCNSSGKSSVIKSLMLLNSYFNTIKEDFLNNKPIPLKQYELLFNKGKHNLGSFQKTLSKYRKASNRNEGMSFSWTKYSQLLCEDVKIEIELVENNTNIFKNGVIKTVKTILRNQVVVLFDFTEDFAFKIDYQLFKKHFFPFVRRVKHYNSIHDWLGFNQERGVPNQFEDWSKLSQQEGISMKAVDSVSYAANHLKQIHGFSSLVSVCDQIPDEALEHELLLYLPILDWLNDVPKNEIAPLVLSKLNLESNEINEAFLESLSTLLKEFEDSDFKTFREYYIESFEKKLTKCFCINDKDHTSISNIVQNDKDKLFDEAVWAFNYTRNKGDKESLTALKKMFLDGSCKDFFDILTTYLFMDAPIHHFHNFNFNIWPHIEDGQPSKYWNDFMLWAQYCLVVDKEFYKNRFKVEEYQPIAPDAKYLKTIEHNAAVTFILSFIQDSFLNLPSFIENVDFVEAVRAQVNRIYAFNQVNDFNDVILSYLNSLESISGKLEKPMHFKKLVNEEGNSYFEISLGKPESIKITKKRYVLSSFMRKWLRKFKLADDVIFENTSEGLGVLIYLVRGEEKELLADQGYGITQLLAIILKIETVILKSEFEYHHPLVNSSTIRYRESTISIEEPETNLHPKFQSLLAEMFMDAYKCYNIRFILETHSEYLIRKLQTLVAKNEISADDVSLNYIYHHDKSKRPAGKPQILNIKINEDGRLSEPFGTGFFDEADNLAMDLLTLKTLN